jgi:hypothetical protein
MALRECLSFNNEKSKTESNASNMNFVSLLFHGGDLTLKLTDFSFFVRNLLVDVGSLIVADLLQRVLIDREKICLSFVEIELSRVEPSVYGVHPRTHILFDFEAVSGSMQPRSQARQSHGGHLGDVRLEKLSPILSLDVEVGLEKL